MLSRPLSRGRRNLVGFSTLRSAVALVLGLVLIGTLGASRLDFKLPLFECVVTPVLAILSSAAFAVMYAREMESSDVSVATDVPLLDPVNLLISPFFHCNIFHLLFCVLSLWCVAKSEEQSSEFYFALCTALFLMVPALFACFLDKSFVELFHLRSSWTSSRLLFLPLFKGRRTLGLGNAVLAWTAAAAMGAVDEPSATISSAEAATLANASAISPKAAAAAAATKAFAAAVDTQRGAAVGMRGPGNQHYGPDAHFILNPVAVLVVLHILEPNHSLSASLVAVGMGIFVNFGGTRTIYWFSMALIWAIFAVRMLVERARQKEQHVGGPRAVANGVDVATGRPVLVRGLRLQGNRARTRSEIDV